MGERCVCRTSDWDLTLTPCPRRSVGAHVRPAWHCSLHCIALHCIALPCPALTALHSPAWYCGLHCTAACAARPSLTALHSPTLLCWCSGSAGKRKRAAEGQGER